jgi:hypothetical protein
MTRGPRQPFIDSHNPDVATSEGWVNKVQTPESLGRRLHHLSRSGVFAFWCRLGPVGREGRGFIRSPEMLTGPAWYGSGETSQGFSPEGTALLVTAGVTLS